jgi:CheY-like chemotaxis protein
MIVQPSVTAVTPLTMLSFRACPRGIVDRKGRNPMASILIIEDSMFQRTIIRDAVREDGHTPVEAGNGSLALEIIRENPPDCIITDLLMPGMDGITFLTTLAQEGSRIPVIVLSADIQETTRQQCMALGAACFLNKPLKRAQLLEALAQVLGSVRGPSS